MRIHSIPNAEHCACLPGGEYVAQVLEGDLLTHRGAVPRCPGGNLLFIDMASDGVRFAGNGQAGTSAWEWDGATWHERGVAFGNNCVLYDAQDVLHVIHEAGTFYGALGYRYVEDNTGRLVGAWETYDPSTPMSHDYGLTNIWEWTHHGGVTVGQGAQNVIIDAVDHQHFVLYESRNVVFVHFKRAGPTCAVSASDLMRSTAVFRWFEESEIAFFPKEQPPPVKPPPIVTRYPPAVIYRRHPTMAYLVLQGKFIGVSPRAVPGATGDDRYPVYANRPTGGDWERCEVTPHESRYLVRFVAANRCLSMTPEGLLQSRAAGSQGPWESFYATSQPDKIDLLYRRHDDFHTLIDPVLTIVESVA